MKVLVAEDDAVAARIARRVLEREGYEVTLATDGLSAWEAVLAGSYDLLVSDWMMPRMDGLELVQRIRATGATRYLYVVLVTALNDISDLLKGLKAGADDYVSKPYHPDELAARVRVGARIVELQDQLRSSQLTLRALATVDPVTGVQTQAAIALRLTAEVARASDSGDPLSAVRLSACQVDAAGLEVEPPLALVRNVATAVAARLRPYDWFGRYASADIGAGVPYRPGELLLLLPGRTQADARPWAVNLCAEITALEFDSDGQSARVLLRAGVAGTDVSGAVAASLVGAAESDLASRIAAEDVDTTWPSVPAA